MPVPPTPQDYARSIRVGPARFAWQDEAFSRFHSSRVAAYLAEPRCGKSSVPIDVAQWRYLQGPDSPLYVDTLLMFALPSGAPLNWQNEALPTFGSPECDPLSLTWRASKASTKTYQEQLAQAENHAGLLFVFVNGEAIITEALLRWMRRWFPKRRILVGGDETTLLIKTAGIKRERKLYAIGRQRTVVARCILDGQPVGEGPLDLFPQYRFLDEKILGFDSITAFKHRYAVKEVHGDGLFRAKYKEGMESARLRGMPEHEREWYAINYARNAGGQGWTAIKKDAEGRAQYQNVEELYAKIAPHSIRVRRRDVYSSPEKIYQKKYFELTDEQRRVYEALRDEYEAELRDGGRIEVRNVLERHMRLQQVTSNYYPGKRSLLACETCDGDDDGCPVCKGAGFVEGAREPPRVIDPDRNPRLDALRDELRNGRPSVVWVRFHVEIDDVLGLCRGIGLEPVEISGRVSQSEKEAAKVTFQRGKASTVVATKSASRAISLPAKQLIHYTNQFSLLTRLQMDDRAELPGNTEGTDIVDLVANDTNDERIITALRHKRRVADAVMRENNGKWL